jgi:putative transposase
VSPERRRRAVTHLQGRFRVSERRACLVASQHRSSQRYCHCKVPDELLLRERLRLLARRHPRYGYRRIHALLRREGRACNRKRVQRLWRDEGLRLPAKARRARRGKRMPGHVAAACPNHVWALDFLVDETADGRPLKILTVTDEYTREALATPAARRMGADDTVSVLERIVEGRGKAPELIRCDNGPELVAHALKDWCRFAGVKTGYIEPGAPWQNPYVESFNGHLRRELLDMESFNSLYEAQLLIEDWRQGYNHYRPHQSLNYQTPAEYAHHLRTNKQPELS